MAQRRMFSKDITGADAFLEMPISSQLLYFQLGMEADDDGFVGSPKKISRMMGAGDDDLKILLSKRFLLVFESGVVVIKHWKINNYIQSDRYKETRYTDEKKLLDTKSNGSYTECIQGVNKMETQVRLGKASKGKVSLGKAIISEPEVSDDTKGVNKVIDVFYQLNNAINYANSSYRKSAETLIKKYGVEKVVSGAVYALSVQTQKYAPQITNPTQLMNKFGDLIIFKQKESASKTFLQTPEEIYGADNL